MNPVDFYNLPTRTGANDARTAYDGDEYFGIYDPDGGASKYLWKSRLADLFHYLRTRPEGQTETNTAGASVAPTKPFTIISRAAAAATTEIDVSGIEEGETFVIQFQSTHATSKVVSTALTYDTTGLDVKGSLPARAVQGDQLVFYRVAGSTNLYVYFIKAPLVSTFEIEFSFTFDGTANKGLNASAITLPEIVPDNTILVERILDFGADLTVSNTACTLSVGIATDGATALQAASDVDSNLVGTINAAALTALKTTGDRNIVMAVGGTGNITAGTVKGYLRGFTGL